MMAVVINIMAFDFTVTQNIIYYIFIAIGALIPDIDMPKSYIGQKFYILSTILYKKFGHRKLFHSFIFYTLLFAIVSLILQKIYIIPLAIMLGAYFHIIGDMSDGKVMCFCPLSSNWYGGI